MTAAAHFAHTLEPFREGEVTIRILVERAGEPIILSFGDSEFSLPPGLAIALGNVLMLAGKCSFKGKHRQVQRAEEQKASQDAASAVAAEVDDAAAFREHRLALAGGSE